MSSFAVNNSRKDNHYSGSHQRFAEAERNLWASVLLAMVHDLYVGSPRERTDAERWVGTFPSADFKLLVSLAGLDPISVFDRLRHVCLIPHDERKQIVRNNGSWNFGARAGKEIAA